MLLPRSKHAVSITRKASVNELQVNNRSVLPETFERYRQCVWKEEGLMLRYVVHIVTTVLGRVKPQKMIGSL